MNLSFTNTISAFNSCKPINETHKVNVLYLAGISYCGSTLMSFLLNAHPHILSIGEMGPAPAFESDDYKCSCGAELIRCPFTLAVKDLMENKYAVPFDTGHWDLRHEYSISRFRRILMTGPLLGAPLLNSIRDAVRPLIPGHKRQIRRYARRNEAFLRAALSVSQKHVFFDATKFFTRIPFLQKISGLNLKVIHMVRDPRGYANSARRHKKKTSHMASREWVRTNRAIEHQLRQLASDQWMRLRYEILCKQPNKTLSVLTNFIGVKILPLTGVFQDVSHHIIGNKMRLSRDPRNSIQLDEKWRDELSEDDLRIIERVTGPLARKYGYKIEDQ